MSKADPDLIYLNDYNYDLPESRIAKYPLEERDQSKLIIKQGQQISIGSFQDLPRYIPRDSIMVFNETRVIQARLVFHKESGARIEIFCLEPSSPHLISEIAFQQKSPVTWKCLVGNAKKWKQGPLKKNLEIQGKSFPLYARMLDAAEDAYLIEFSWEDQSFSFSEVLDAAGKVPLPPYIKRDSEEDDRYRYQTIYARNDGSVAAPTAGLHFSDRVFRKLEEKGILSLKLTLHVGAGTFKPVNTPTIREHSMHRERIQISKSFIESILKHEGSSITAVGTTSVRSLESLYWLGLKIIKKGVRASDFLINQWDPYEMDAAGIPATESLGAVLDLMRKKNMETISGQTQLIIIPGYRFRLTDIMVTNFHMPRSTLLLLVAAFVGKSWKDIYQKALDEDFRFLSYGDSCLFFRDP
jgi:S-adenosylmethionine:tRNA ribosyltransferase-isomerase